MGFSRGDKRSLQLTGNKMIREKTGSRRSGKKPVKRSGNHSKYRKSADEQVRLNKYIAASGVCSRREADELILRGEITVNGRTITGLGHKVEHGDEVRYKNKLLAAEKMIYILLNKPKDYVTTTSDPHADKTVLDLIGDKCPERVYPVGRLDKSTTGVLLLTNDGDLAGKLTHPRHKRRKIYHVFLDRDVVRDDLFRLTAGIDLEGEIVACDAVSYVDQLDRSQVGVELHSGQNRVVRRLFEHLGYKVKKLDRVYFAGLTKKNLPRGKWRFLTEREIAMLKRGIY